MPKKQYIRVASYAVIAKEKQILLCRIAPHIKRWAGHWTLPGGGLDFGETPEENLIREVEEETGLIVHPRSILTISSLVDTDDEEVDIQGVRIIYDVDIIGGEIRDERDESTDRCEWHSLPLPEHMKLTSLAKIGAEVVSKES